MGSNHTEGLKFARLLMVVGSMSPLFILWAIRGDKLIPDTWLISLCAAMVLIPNFFIWLRIIISKRNEDNKQITIEESEDHRDHTLVYLFSMLLPFYSEEFGSIRNLSATITAISFIIFLFWHLNLHYMNILFAAKGYKVFTVSTPKGGNSLNEATQYVVITWRSRLPPNETITAYRISNTVYMEFKWT